MPWVFSYSDLAPNIVEGLLERAPFCSLPASLPNFKISFKGRSRKWGGALATLEKSRKSWVYGSALFVTPEELQILDKYYSAFGSKELNILIEATKDKVKAHTYILNPSLPYGEPSEEYIKAILKHLKFFWGQPGTGKMTLEKFGISLDPVLEKKDRKKRSMEEESPEEDGESDDAPDGDSTEVAEKPKKRRRRTVKKK